MKNSKQSLLFLITNRISSLLVILFLSLSMHGTGQVQNERTAGITVNATSQPLKEILKLIEKQCSYTFSFSPEVGNISPVSLSIDNKSLGEVLRTLGQRYKLQFKAVGSMIAVTRLSVVNKPSMVAPKKNPGKISGRIIDEENGYPVGGASISMSAAGVANSDNKGITADADGFFSISLSKGNYTVTISHVGYGAKVITDISIEDNRDFDLNVTLKREKGQLSAVVVRASAKKESAAFLYTQQKNSATISDGISREQISVTPDNNVGQVLKRVSGLTVKENKFVVVRGMSERYNNIQLNGAILPSTEPNRRNFSFDIIPSGLVDNVVINKTFTPDLPAEFSGGLVQVNTIDIPNQGFITIGAGAGFNTNSTGKNFESTQRFKADYFGGGKERSWYNRTWQYNEFSAVYTPGNLSHRNLTKMNEINKNIPNLWGLHDYTAKPTSTFQVTAGQRYRLKHEHTIGLIIAGTYRHEENTEDFKSKFRNHGDTTLNGKVYRFMTAMGGIANVSWQHKKHKISWRNLYNRRFIHNTTVQDLTNFDGAGWYHEYYSTVLINTLWQTRLEGEHTLMKKGLKLSWFADYNDLVREQPDDRFSKASYTTFTAAGEPIYRQELHTPFTTQSHIFSTMLYETKKNAGANIEQPFTVLGNQQKIKAGYWGTFRDVEFEQVALRPLQAGSNSFAGLPDYQIFTPENFTNNQLYYTVAYVGSGSDGDQYTGNQEVHAGYLMADLLPFRKLRLTGGVRLEEATMDVKTTTRLNTGDPANPIRWKDTAMRYRNTDWLPAITAIYSITPQINFRLAYSKTLARPDFRERSHYKYYDVNDRAEMLGNGALQQSYTHNYDLRAEWYPGAGEVVALSGFYKKFISPVEIVSYSQQSGGYTFMYFNLENSEVKGAEADFRKSLGFIQKNSAWLQKIFISGNFTWLQADVEYNAQKLSDQAQGLRPDQVDSSSYKKPGRHRPLQGMSPYIINAGISYQGDRLGASVSYNRIGRRLVIASQNEYADEFENSRDVLDAQLSARLLKHKLEIKLNATDLLNQYVIVYRNTNEVGERNKDPKGIKFNPDADWILNKSKRGTGFSLSVSYRF